MDEIVFVVEEAPEGRYAVLRDAVVCHYEDEADRPRVIRLHFVRDSPIAV